MPKKIRILKKELWNLDSTLADIIHQYLVAFKASERHLILYSHEFEDPEFKFFDDNGLTEYSDDTEWFLDELIWTFATLANGSETPEYETLLMEIFGEADLSVDHTKHQKYEEFIQLGKEIETRIQRGLDLFTKRFSHLGD